MAWFSCAQKLFGKDNFSDITFKIVLALLKDNDKKEETIICTKARLYIGTNLLRVGNIVDGEDYLQKASSTANTATVSITSNASELNKEESHLFRTLTRTFA